MSSCLCSAQPNTDFAYDPPPSFTEATTASPTAEPAPGPPDYPQQGQHAEAAGDDGVVEPNAAGPAVEAPAATDEPPPPSYEEAVAGGAV